MYEDFRKLCDEYEKNHWNGWNWNRLSSIDESDTEEEYEDESEDYDYDDSYPYGEEDR